MGRDVNVSHFENNTEVLTDWRAISELNKCIYINIYHLELGWRSH